MKYGAIIFGVLLGMASLPALATDAEQSAVMAQIKKQFREYELQLPTEANIASSVTRWTTSLTPEGTWSDIDYTSQGRGTWLAMTHISRLNKMCRVYASPKEGLRSDPALSKAIHLALDYWLRNDFQNPNWWHNEIGVPREISIILLLLEPELSSQERDMGIKIISRSVIDSPPHDGRGVLTGENRVWVAENALNHGLLESNYNLVQQARDVIFEEVQIATDDKPAGPRHMKDGIKPDFSFFQHGPMLQLGNYGEAFAGDIIQKTIVLRGTPLALDLDKVAIMRDYLLKGESTVLWKGSMDISSCGRQLGSQSPKKKGEEVLRILSQAESVDPAHWAEYQTAIKQHSSDASAQIIPARNSLFWCADYMVHQRAGYYASTRMNSSRVLPTELVNGENLQGTYLGDGATYIYQTGGEYEDIFPVWDWSRIPGVTSPQVTDKKMLRTKNGVFTNSAAFVGGASDGRYGVAVLDLDRDGVSAKKGWFYFDDMIVCLGAGISSSTADMRTIRTSINQCMARGNVIVDDSKGPAASQSGLHEYSNLKWVYHDRVGYFFPKTQKVILGCQDQTGSWNEVSSAGKPDTITQNVFSIWIDHGASPQGGQYSYIILPGATVEKLSAALPDVKILSNTTTLQAVRDEKLKLTQAIFFAPGTLTFDGTTVGVDQPCILLFDEANRKITMADPTAKLTSITLAFDGSASKLQLPVGSEAGRSMTQSMP
jgi:chondroitin AC lyase